MEHLTKLGHRRMAFIKGQAFSSDTAIRWESVRTAAQGLGVTIQDCLVGQLEGESSSPELGYQVTRKLIASGAPFTALFAFNDISAIGAIQALREAGRQIPQDVSVVGFDDIQSAAFQNPALTTVRQAAAGDGNAVSQHASPAHCGPTGSLLPKRNCSRT